MRYRRQAAGVAVVAACVIGAVTGSAAAASSDGGTKSARDAESQRTSSATTQSQLNTADVEFVRMMIPHHYQALVMTRLAPERSSDEQLLKLAERINVGQGVEIDAMRGWQARNGLPVTDAQESYQRVLEQPELLEQMGMATPAEMQELREARGNEFDVLFLQLMIPHHEGAVRMAEQVIINGRDIFVRQLAMDIMVTQKDQINTMREMLEQKTS